MGPICTLKYSLSSGVMQEASVAGQNGRVQSSRAIPYLGKKADQMQGLQQAPHQSAPQEDCWTLNLCTAES